jgi:hypothetical protein
MPHSADTNALFFQEVSVFLRAYGFFRWQLKIFRERVVDIGAYEVNRSFPCLVQKLVV